MTTIELIKTISASITDDITILANLKFESRFSAIKFIVNNFEENKQDWTYEVKKNGVYPRVKQKLLIDSHTPHLNNMLVRQDVEKS